MIGYWKGHVYDQVYDWMQLEMMTHNSGNWREIVGGQCPGRATSSKKRIHHSLGYGVGRKAILES